MAVGDGPVQYTNLTLREEEVITCVQRGLYLIRDHGTCPCRTHRRRQTAARE